MERELFEGRPRKEIVEAVKRLRAEGNEAEADRITDLLAVHDLRTGKLDAPAREQ